MPASHVGDRVTVVLAPNPSPMTLEGTNTYLVGARGHGEVLVIDPGPDMAEHRQAVEAGARERDAAIAGVLLTHHHADHAGGAAWAHQWGADLWAFDPRLVPVPTRSLEDDEIVERAGVRLQALHTPGHCRDHLCLRLMDSGEVFTGDHVLGRGTTMVAWPDGDMTAYLESLERLRSLDAPVLYPGHGPVVTEPTRTVDEYLAHRHEREAQVLAALRSGSRTVDTIVSDLYADVDPALHPAAARSVRAHLDRLVAQGRVRRDPDGVGTEESYDA